MTMPWFDRVCFSSELQSVAMWAQSGDGQLNRNNKSVESIYAQVRSSCPIVLLGRAYTHQLFILKDHAQLVVGEVELFQIQSPG